jgi:hypothetical protein
MVSNEIVVPILPCVDVDEIIDFYLMLGFERTCRQLRPNPYACVRHGAAELHFAGITGFDPEESYGSCVIGDSRGDLRQGRLTARDQVKLRSARARAGSGAVVPGRST